MQSIISYLTLIFLYTLGHVNAATIGASSSCVGSSFNFDDFFSWQNHMDYLSCLCDKFPDRAQTIDIGKSVEGRALRVIKIGRPRPDGMAKTAIWIDGGTHAREWISPAAVEYLVNQLVENSSSIEINKFVDTFDIYVLPILNPDGYEYSRIGGIGETGDGTTHKRRLWRKNRAPNNGTNCFGVDLNRNWGYKWGGTKTSSNPCNTEVYRGPRPFSEPETSAVRDFINKQKQFQEFMMFLTVHSWGKLIIYGWGYDKRAEDPPNVNSLRSMAKLASKAMEKETGECRYKVGRTAKVLYEASGVSDDWALASGDFRYSYTIELPPKSFYYDPIKCVDSNPQVRFELPAVRILPVSKEIFTGITTMMRKLLKEIDFS